MSLLEMKALGGYVYVCSPYTADDAVTTQLRVDRVRDFTSYLFDNGVSAYSPIVHHHNLNDSMISHKSGKVWFDFAALLLPNASAIVVNTQPDWEASFGVQEEIRLATENKLPIFYMDMDLH